jgi:TM2 domain-containing membrane protein YozV
MKGQILNYSVQSNSGIISGDDNQRYRFNGADWMEYDPPRRGMQVDFDIIGTSATEIYAALGARQPYAYGGGRAKSYSKKKVTAGVLAIVVGGLGIHKFYMGYTGPGIILLLCGTIGWVLIVPAIIANFIGLIEGILYLTKQDDEFEQKYVVEQKSWF